MFEDSLVESAALLRTHNRWPALLSLTAQCSIALLVVSLPLFHPELMPTQRVLPAILAPPRAPTPPPAIRLRETPSAASASLPAAPSASRTGIFGSLLRPAGPATNAPALPAIDFGSTNPAIALGITSAAPASPHIAVAPAAGKAHSGPLNISSGITAGHLIAPILPVYPQIARTTHTQGTVVVEAIISRTGHIESAHVVSGPPVLRAAALDAVNHARYRPFLLNAQPTEVQTTITFVFRMDG